MTPQRWQAIKEVFLGALEREAGDRPGFVAGACAGDPRLKRQVEALLADHEHTGTFLESPALDPDLPWPGRQLGAYRILEELGEGGMGTVYLAQRADSQYSQQVAVKLIRRGMASDLVVARFRQERQILAHLNHPGIARLLDGGATADGQPYLVMEYVAGVPIDEDCDRRRLSIDERLELFRKVCAAVHYAHQNLVIHRDIKPSNILVTADGEPKLLDFGTAKLLERSLAEPDLASTATGWRLMTPEYASPELMRAETVTTASDVYALGVILYELLTGLRPYRFPDRHSPEMLRIVCEQEPEPPSGVVHRRGSQAAAVADGSRRREARGKLRRRLRGDLDNIVLMALRKEAERRYVSVGQLSEDIRRHLAGLPVLARKDTWSYHLGKFVGRHRIAVAAGALASFALMVGGIVALWQARVAHRERTRAEVHLAEAREQRTKAERVARFLVDIFEVSKPSEARGRDLTAREILERGEEKLRTELRDQPEVRAALMDAIGAVYQKIALYEPAAALMEEALELRRETLGEKHLDMAASWSHVGLLYLHTGRHEAAESFLERALALRRELLGEEDPLVATSLDDLGRLRYERGDFAAAEALHSRALELRRRLFGDGSREAAESLNNLAAAIWRAGLPEASEALFREALAIRRELFGDRHPDTTNSLYNLAALLLDQEDYAAVEPLLDEALEIDRELLGDVHPTLAGDLDLLATVHLRQGHLGRAEDLYRQTLAMRRELFGTEHPDVAFSLNNLGVVMQKLGRHDAALTFYRQALDLRRRLLGEAHPDVAFSLEVLAELLGSVGRHDEAQDLYRQALAIHRRNPPDARRVVASIESELGECLTALGRFDEAEDFLLRGLDALEAALGPDAEPVLETRRRLVELYHAWGRRRQEAR